MTNVLSYNNYLHFTLNFPSVQDILNNNSTQKFTIWTTISPLNNKYAPPDLTSDGAQQSFTY